MGCGASSAASRGAGRQQDMACVQRRPESALGPQPEPEPEPELKLELEPEPEPEQQFDSAPESDGEESMVRARPRKLDPIEGHFILMDGWEEGLRHRTENVKLATFEANTKYLLRGVCQYIFPLCVSLSVSLSLCLSLCVAVSHMHMRRSRYEHSWRPPPVRNALTEWLREIGLGHKEGMIQERLYLNLWRVSLSLSDSVSLSLFFSLSLSDSAPLSLSLSL